MSLGKHKPVVLPRGVRVAIHPYSSRISAPIPVDEMRPMTKKHVLDPRSFQHVDQTIFSRTHPLMVKTGECSAISMMTSIISSFSRNGSPPSVEPILPCLVVNLDPHTIARN
jgi:hypothetical protein